MTDTILTCWMLKLRMSRFFSFSPGLNFRYKCYLDHLDWINKVDGIERFTQGYKEFGINVHPDGTIHCKEWAPGAKEVYLRGDFSKCL